MVGDHLGVGHGRRRRRHARDVRAAGRSSRRSACATPARSTATTSRASSGRCATPPSTTGRSSSTSSRRRAAATRRPRRTTRSACTTAACSTSPPARRPAPAASRPTRRRSPRRSSRRPRSGPRSSPSPRPCPAPPACSRSRSASPTASSTSASPSSTRSPSAAGMAMGGLRPVVAIYSTFLTRAFDQANLDVGLHGQPVVFCLDRAGITGDNGASHHGVLDMVLLTKVPGMTVFAPVVVPGAAGDAPRRARHHERARRPSAGRTPRRATVGEDEVGHGLSGRKVREGDDVCHRRRRQAAGRGRGGRRASSATDGVSATVWDPRVVKPLDDGDARRPAAASTSWSRPRTATPRAASARRSPRRWSSGPSRAARPRPDGARAGRARPLHPPGQAGRHPLGPRPRRTRPRGRGPPDARSLIRRTPLPGSELGRAAGAAVQRLVGYRRLPRRVAEPAGPPARRDARRPGPGVPRAHHGRPCSPGSSTPPGTSAGAWWPA